MLLVGDGSPLRALESSTDPFNPTAVHGDSLMTTVGVFMRKGIWLPLPSFEVGLGAVHLGGSQMWAAQGYAKFALHEGFHELPLPSVAVRGSASRVIGSDQIDLTVGGFDISISKELGLGGTVNFAPYGGWNLLWIIPRSEVIDKTPHFDLADTPGDTAMNFVFVDQDNITRHKLFLGFKLQYYVFEVTFQADIALAGSSTDDRSGDMACVAGSVTENCDATDEAASQRTFTASVGLDF
jgi:hypothetical protein